jgi:hypothetical protein
MSIIKQTKGAFTALFLFFIFNFIASANFVQPPAVSPDSDTTCLISHVTSAAWGVDVGDDCGAVSASQCQEVWGASPYATGVDRTISWRNISGYLVPDDNGVHLYCTLDTWRNTAGTWAYQNSTDGLQVSYSFTDAHIYFCPPASHPDYIYSQDSNDDGDVDICFKDNPNFQLCDSGFHKYAVSSGGLPAACVPIDCPNAGVQSSEWVDGSVYGNNAGTYCNGQCAYSIDSGANSSQTTGNFGATVVSTGNVCGQDPNSDKWMQDGYDDECETSTIPSTGSSFVSCPNANPQEHTDDDLPKVDNSEDEYFLQDMIELETIEETCTTGDSACEIRNLKEKIQTEGVEQKELLVELHNKMVSADENSYNVLAETIQNLQDTNNFGLEKIATQLADSSTSGGGGSDAIDVEGAGLSDEEVAEAVGGFDHTIPEEFIDIPSYTATYSGWLNGGVCPVSKDITLTILGTTTTFDLTWAPLCDIFSLIGILLQASAWITVGFMIQRTL